MTTGADNLAESLAELGLAASHTPSPLNLFMNIPWNAEGGAEFRPSGQCARRSCGAEGRNLRLRGGNVSLSAGHPAGKRQGRHPHRRFNFELIGQQTT